jgi:hypothetical protein
MKTLPPLLFFFFYFEHGLEYKEKLLWRRLSALSVTHKKELEIEQITSNIS